MVCTGTPHLLTGGGTRILSVNGDWIAARLQSATEPRLFRKPGGAPPIRAMTGLVMHVDLDAF
jgi:hypothetical protein